VAAEGLAEEPEPIDVFALHDHQVRHTGQGRILTFHRAMTSPTRANAAWSPVRVRRRQRMRRANEAGRGRLRYWVIR
jgi:hypothetical protein